MCNAEADANTDSMGYLCECCYFELEDSYESTGLDMDFEDFMGTTWL